MPIHPGIRQALRQKHPTSAQTPLPLRLVMRLRPRHFTTRPVLLIVTRPTRHRLRMPHHHPSTSNLARTIDNPPRHRHHGLMLLAKAANPRLWPKQIRLTTISPILGM